MSCDDNKDARAKDRVKRRSLPIVTASAPAAAKREPRYWRSIEERNAALKTLAGVNEFPPGADELAEGSVSRRTFMQLLGASTALVSVGACMKPNEKIIPFVRRPEDVTPGNPLHFATAYALEGWASGLLVTSHEGRPTKIEGNPQHPDTLGATTAIEQALILGLYDDNRAKQLRRGAEPMAWRAFLTDMKARNAKLAETKGAGLRFLVEPTSSPVLGDLRRRILARFPAAKFVSYASTTSEGAAEGPRMAFGQSLVARHRLDKAQII